MRTIDLEVVEWLDGGEGEPTLGALRIRVGDEIVTEVSDLAAKATRDTVRVPAEAVATWLLAHWWRLIWESRPDAPGTDWRLVHSMAALGGGTAWPPLEISGDGEFVQLSLRPERQPDVAAIKYLRSFPKREVPRVEYEAAVERFVDAVEARLESVGAGHLELRELREEILRERLDERAARRARLQARAGFDPGDAPSDWLETIDRLASRWGRQALEEVLAAAGPSPDPRAIEAAVAAIHRSRVKVDLSAAASLTIPPSNMQPPWQRGSGAAVALRQRLGLAEGPVTNDRLAEIFGARLPVDGSAVQESGIVGGVRESDGIGATHVLVRSARARSQRFFLARLLGLAIRTPGDEALLPISDASTAPQKFARAFAQEFLCPWQELDAFTDEHGTGEDALARAAERYQISEMAVTTSLVNHGKLDRASLAAFD